MLFPDDTTTSTTSTTADQPGCSSLRTQGGERGAGDPPGQANKDANNSIPLWVRIHIGVVWLVTATGLSVDRGGRGLQGPLSPSSQGTRFPSQAVPSLKNNNRVESCAGMTVGGGREGDWSCATTQGKYPQQHRAPRSNNGGVISDRRAQISIFKHRVGRLGGRQAAV